MRLALPYGRASDTFPLHFHRKSVRLFVYLLI